MRTSWLRRTGLIHDFMETILFPASNLKIFCSSCGQNCPLEAKYCHKCGELLKQNVTEGAGSVDEGSKKDESGSKPGATGSGIGTSGLLTFAQFRSRKEEVAWASSLNAFKELWDNWTFNLIYMYHLGASRSLVHRKHRPSSSAAVTFFLVLPVGQFLS